MEARSQIAGFVGALIDVYTLIIFASIIVSWIFSFGVRVPYSRPVNAVLDFLRDVTNPYLRIFRRLGLQFGPIDFSPIVAILVLQVGGNILVRLIVRAEGAHSKVGAAVGRDVKGTVSALFYVVAIPLSFVHCWLALGLYILVAAIWFIPDRRMVRPEEWQPSVPEEP